jgi:chemotaxis protein methyltransferase CheR
MGFNSESLGLPKGAEILLRDLVHDRTGLFYENGNFDLLIEKLAPLVINRGFESFLDYYYLLKYDESGAEEWARVMNALSVQETYFWREMDQINGFIEKIVPSYFSNSTAEPMRIWCAAAATGEEPLTIAMALEEKGWFDRAPIEIYATDASSKAVERASTGLYRERSMRALPDPIRRKYFTEENGRWRIAQRLQKRLNWSLANLVDPESIVQFARSPVIFCRNVFIYFSENSIRKTVRVMAERMPSPGYLFVSVSESLLRITNDFDLEELGGAFVYVKR